MKKMDERAEGDDEKEGEKMENEDGGHKKRKFEDQDNWFDFSLVAYQGASLIILCSILFN